MDFGMLPPEINSDRMYTGPGSGPMLAAAAAWDEVVGGLQSAAVSYRSVISGLTAGWQGPSSVAMASAATPYMAWMSATAMQAEQAAAQARGAAAAYQNAFEAMVPPPVIAANRSELASLVETNILGHNIPAIAATEAQYEDMWAQDAAAMYGYAAASASASRLSPFSPPPQTTDAGGAASQSAAVAQAVGAASANAHPALSQLMSATPQALQSLATPAAVDPPASLSSLTNFLSDLNSSPLARVAANVEFVTKSIRPFNDTALSISMGLVAAARTINDQATALSNETGLLASGGLGPGAQMSGGGGGSAVSAGVGTATAVGGLSVPPSWAAATPEIRLAATVLQGTSTGAAPAVGSSIESLGGEMALASLAGGALGAPVPPAILRTASRRVGTPKPDKDSKTPDKLTRVLAELSQKPESVQHWHTDKAHLEGLLDELSKKPGVHAVHLSSANKAKPMPPKARWG